MASILIIEDDNEVREFLESVLTRAGYQTHTAANGREGVQVFRTGNFDLVITDIIMPEKDGIETIMDMKRERSDLRVLAISGGGRAEPDNYLESARLLGADATMKKPFTNQEIIATVKQLLE
ncbi:response regulator [bacterium]|nr:MAG: response regulator [bacterium]